MENTKKFNVLEVVNERIISQLEKGINPWIKPWVDGLKSFSRNAKTNKIYKGINQYLLPDTGYLTFNQIRELGGKLRKGSKAEWVVYANTITKEKELVIDGMTTTEEDKYFLLKYYNVFNIEDIENLQELKIDEKLKEIATTNAKFKEFDSRTIEKADAIINNYIMRSGLQVEHCTTGGAWYNSQFDILSTPYSKQFDNVLEYYSTMFHELAHSTARRVNRKIGGMFGNDAYAKEELIAEITSVLCLNYLGIDSSSTTKNSVAYLQNWSKQLKEKSKTWYILNATNEAEKAFKYIFDIKEEEEE